MKPDWRQQQERSNRAILRLMVWISLTFGRRIGRLVKAARDKCGCSREIIG